jgi:hypothetical protein
MDEVYMNKIFMISIFMGCVAAVQAEVDCPSYADELAQVQLRLIHGLELCKSENLTSRACESKHFKFTQKKLDEYSCRLGYDAFESIYQGTCNDAMQSSRECALIRGLSERFKHVCKAHENKQ